MIHFLEILGREGRQAVSSISGIRFQVVQLGPGGNAVSTAFLIGSIADYQQSVVNVRMDVVLC